MKNIINLLFIYWFFSSTAIAQSDEKIWQPASFASKLEQNKELDLSVSERFPIRTIIMKNDKIFFDTFYGRYSEAKFVKEKNGKSKIINLHSNINLSHYLDTFKDMNFYLVDKKDSIVIERTYKEKIADTLIYILVNKTLKNIKYPLAEGYLLLSGSFEAITTNESPYNITFHKSGKIVSPVWDKYTILTRSNIIENPPENHLSNYAVELVDKRGNKTEKILVHSLPSSLTLYNFRKDSKHNYVLNEDSKTILYTMVK
ncbi:MAG: hypothetical protein LBE37_14105 [Sphingobacterium sp.]|jgi:hypothetical protein|nr:hypothetical protein [Sphingobacterium sp.]